MMSNKRARRGVTSGAGSEEEQEGKEEEGEEALNEDGVRLCVSL